MYLRVTSQYVYLAVWEAAVGEEVLCQNAQYHVSFMACGSVQGLLLHANAHFLINQVRDYAFYNHSFTREKHNLAKNNPLYGIP